MTVELTDKEVKLANKALEKFAIELGGLHSVGMCSKETLGSLKNIQKKINGGK